MALFKILKGNEQNLPASKTEGYAYFTEDKGNFFVDVSSSKRMQLNANHAVYDIEEFDSPTGDNNTKVPIHEKFLKLTGGVMEGNIVFSPPQGIWQMQANSTKAPFVGWISATSGKTYSTSLGRNATYVSGGETGAIYILPYDTETSPYDGAAGLLIAKGLLKLDGKLIPQLTNAASTDERIARFDGTSGALQDSKVTLDDTGHILPIANNTQQLGSNALRWNGIYANVTYSNGGISLYGTSDPKNDGIIESSSVTSHGYTTGTWKTQFGMSGSGIGGWTFAVSQTPVASISEKGYASFNRLNLNRNGGFQNGRISWMSTSHYVWHHYLSDQTAGSSPNEGKPSGLGKVTGWALRSLAENSTNAGWVWEAASNAKAASTSTSTTPVMALSASTGNLYLSNDLKIVMKDTDKFVHYLYDGTDANPVGASWRAGVLGSGSNNTNYYVIQSGTATAASSTWYNTVRIGQVHFDVTVGQSAKGSFGIANTANNSGAGISLYGGAPETGKPTYGLFFGGTATFGTHGAINGDWATYFTMNDVANRGWIFLRGNTRVASISSGGIMALSGNEAATGVNTGTLRITGGLSASANSYFANDLTVAKIVDAQQFKASVGMGIANTATSYIVSPGGGQYTADGSQTGIIKITLPVSWTSTMLRFNLEIYNYVTNSSATYTIGGYNYGSSPKWYNTFAYTASHNDSNLGDLPVYFGHDGTKCAIYVGNADTSWSYPKFVISNVFVGHTSAEYSKWASGWNLSIVSSRGTLSADTEILNPSIGRRNVKEIVFVNDLTKPLLRYTLNNSTVIDREIPVASETQAGVITTSTQALKGDKSLKGTLRIYPQASNYCEGIRVYPYGGWSDIVLAGSDAGASGISANSWFIGNNNGNFKLTRNSSGEGSAYLNCTSNSWKINNLNINGENTSYKFYVNGASFFNGEVKHNGTVYFANNTTYYIDNTGHAKFKTQELVGNIPSTSTTTGTLRVTGGVGVTGQMNADTVRIKNAVRFEYNSTDKCVDVIFD